MKEKTVYTYMNIEKVDYFVGTLTFHYSEDDEYSTFEYSKEWLENKYRHPLGFDLPLKEGVFNSKDLYPNQYHKIFYSLLIPASVLWPAVFVYPYLWLYLKKKKQLPKNANFDIKILYNFFTVTDRTFTINQLNEDNIPLELLINLNNDFTRSGALRFKFEKDGDFINPYSKVKLPTEDDFEKILNIQNRIKNNKETPKEFEKFLACTSSLAGFMPKMNILDYEGNLCIAKYGSIGYDISAFGEEYLGLLIAKKFGLKLQEFKVKYTENKEPYLILKRFDRKGEIRYPLMELDRLVNFQTGKKYIPNIVRKFCNKTPVTSMREYFKRLIFRLVTFTRNDERGNVAFIYDTNKGWSLAPAYDITFKTYEAETDPIVINKILRKKYRRTRTRVKRLKRMAHLYQINDKEFNKIMKQLNRATIGWKNLALKIGYKKEDLISIQFFPDCLKCTKIY